MRRLSFCNLLVLSALASSILHGQNQSYPKSRYPNELPKFRFYESSKWKGLAPFVSSMADVRKVLGDPSGDYGSVIRYQLNDDWELFVYSVKARSYDDPQFPESLNDRVYTFDLIPKKRTPFGNMQFLGIFTKKRVVAVDAAWFEYSDGTGLSYEVYTSPGPYDKEKPGDLSRIVYGPSDDEIKTAIASQKK
jgi:hypothetical protein